MQINILRITINDIESEQSMLLTPFIILKSLLGNLSIDCSRMVENIEHVTCNDDVCTPVTHE